MTISRELKQTLGVTAAMVLAGLSLGGCVLAAGAAGGYVAADEINEGDGKFDPLEKRVPELYDEDDADD